MAESVWAREYLKSKGAKDNEIDYQNGAVTYKNKPFQYTTPQADGKAYGTQNELDAAYKAYQGNELLGQYENNIKKAPTPFSYDINSIKADPLFTSALNSFTQDTNRGTNQSLSNLGRRGIGNSQSAVTAELAGQQNINNYANNQLAPQVIAQKYQQYQDMNTQQDKQNQGLLGLAGYYDQQNQQFFNNNLATNQDRRADQAQNFNQGVTEAGLTGYYDQYVNQRKQMENNSKSWFDASPEEQYRLSQENKTIGSKIGATQNENGDWQYQQPQRTLAGQGQAFNQNLATDQFNYGKEQDNIQNTAQYAGTYNGQPTMQRIMQSATLANMSSDNARAAASEARQVGNQQLGNLFDVWDRTGSAPEGIPGVAPGTPIAGKSTSAADTKEALKKMEKEKSGLVSALRGGLTPAQARQTIKEDLDFGFYTADEARELLSILGKFVGNNTPSIGQTVGSLMNPMESLMNQKG